MSNQCPIEQLKANGARCRALAESASDPEARFALAKIADDIESAVPILEQSARRDDDDVKAVS